MAETQYKRISSAARVTCLQGVMRLLEISIAHRILGCMEDPGMRQGKRVTKACGVYCRIPIWLIF